MKILISRRIIVLAASVVVVAAAAAAPSMAEPASFKVALSGTQQVPPVQTAGTGTAALTYDPATRALTWSVTYGGLTGPVTMAHFHGPATADGNAAVVIWLTRQGSAAESPINGQTTLTAEQAQQFTAGEWYINLHTQAHPAGELRGQVVPPKK